MFGVRSEMDDARAESGEIARGAGTVSRLHICSVCGKVDVWGRTWEWFGSEVDVDEGRPITKVCSEACKRKAPRGRVGDK